MATATLTDDATVIRQAEAFAAVLAAGSRAYRRAVALGCSPRTVRNMTATLLEHAVDEMLIEREEAGEIVSDNDAYVALGDYADATRRTLDYLFPAK